LASDGFAELLERVRPRLKRECRRWCHDQADIEDLVQHAFLMATEGERKHPESFATDEAFLRWAIGVAYNKFRDLYRQGRPRLAPRPEQQESGQRRKWGDKWVVLHGDIQPPSDDAFDGELDHQDEHEQSDPQLQVIGCQNRELVCRVVADIEGALSPNALQIRMFKQIIDYKIETSECNDSSISGSGHMQGNVVMAMMTERSDLSRDKLVSAYQTLYQKIKRLSKALLSCQLFLSAFEKDFATVLYGSERGGTSRTAGEGGKS